MRGRTHVLLGVAAATPVAVTTSAVLPVVAGAAIGSLLPDMDHPGSSLGKLVHVPLGHRGPLHSLLAAAVFAFAALFLLPASLSEAVAAGLGVGYVAHLLCDLPSGRVALLWPLGRGGD